MSEMESIRRELASLRRDLGHPGAVAATTVFDLLANSEERFDRTDKTVDGLLEREQELRGFSDRLTELHRLEGQNRKSIDLILGSDSPLPVTHAELEQLRERIAAIDKTVYGDVDGMIKWEAEQTGHVTPKMNKPAPGLIDKLSGLLAEFRKVRVYASETGVMVSKVKRIDEHLSQLLAKQPATKLDIDEANNKFAAAIYERLDGVKISVDDRIRGLQPQIDDISSRLDSAYKWAMKFKKWRKKDKKIVPPLQRILDRIGK